MTTTELLTKFKNKNKKTGVSSDKLIEVMTQILKKINPIKQTIQGKMYLSLKNKWLREKQPKQVSSFYKILHRKRSFPFVPLKDQNETKQQQENVNTVKEYFF